MAMLAFRSRSPIVTGGAAMISDPAPTIAAGPARRERLAIVSTHSKLCGIAAYSAALRRQLRGAFDITVFNLDQYLLRSTHRHVRRMGDRHIKEICRAIRQFDAVNLQLEHGTLGRHGADIYRRFGWIVAAAPRLSVTFHTLLQPPAFDGASFARALVTLKWRAAARMQADFARDHLLSFGIARRLRRAQRWKQVSAVVHNRRDLYDAKYLYGIQNVFDHPLAFIGAGEAEAVRTAAARAELPILESLPTDAVLIGVFGFLNEYKGFGTAIQALQYLPKNHHLLIFGGIHPNEIKAREPIHPYIVSLHDQAYIDTSLYRRIGIEGQQGGPGLVLAADRCLGELLGPHPRDLSDRVHFMGALGDAEFLTGMALCDAVVFPYLEVGQSSSGPISQALELGCRIIASRTRAFLEFAEYHKEAIEFFDIGNHVELAERIRARPQFPGRKFPDFNIETNRATYICANGRLPGRLASLVQSRAALPHETLPR